MSFWPVLRPRYDAFGETASAESITTPGFYRFHLGEVITAGADNWAVDRPYYPPPIPLWGGGTPRNPWAWALPTNPVDAGLVATQFAPYGSLSGAFPIEQINEAGVYG
jgi:hypothetical protein